MKLENLEQYQNEEGQIDIDKLNEDIMKETNRSFNKGQEKAISEFNSKSKEEAKFAEKRPEEDVKVETNSELESLKKQIEELKADNQNTREQSILKSFEKKAKEAGLTDEQVQFYKESSKLEALDNFNFDLVGRKQVENVGTPTNEPDKQVLDEKQEKQRLLDLAKNIRK